MNNEWIVVSDQLNWAYLKHKSFCYCCAWTIFFKFFHSNQMGHTNVAVSNRSFQGSKPEFSLYVIWWVFKREVCELITSFSLPHIFMPVKKIKLKVAISWTWKQVKIQWRLRKVTCRKTELQVWMCLVKKVDGFMPLIFGPFEGRRCVRFSSAFMIWLREWMWKEHGHPNFIRCQNSTGCNRRRWHTRWDDHLAIFNNFWLIIVLV